MPLLNDHLLEFSSHSFIFAHTSFVEKTIIEAITQYKDRLLERGLYQNDLSNLQINAAFNKKMATNNQITVEYIPTRNFPLNFGNSQGSEEDAVGNTWKIYSTKCQATLEITIRSQNRAPVGRIADIVMVGLMYPIYKALVEINLELPINNITAGRIEPDREPGFENLFKTVLRFPEMYVDIKQMYREDGYTAEEIGLEITQEP